MNNLFFKKNLKILFCFFFFYRKKILAPVIGFFILIAGIIFLNSWTFLYYPSNQMQKYIWPRIYPFLVLLFSIYPVFLNILMSLKISLINDPYNKLKRYLQNKNATRVTIWQAWWWISIIVPAIIICMLEASLGLLTYF